MHQRQLSDYKTHKNMLHGWTFSRKQKYNKKLTGMSEMKHKKKRSMKTHNAHKKHKKYKTKQSTKCGQPQTQWNEVANGHIQSSSEQFLSMHIEMIKEIETRREKKTINNIDDNDSAMVTVKYNQKRLSIDSALGKREQWKY